MNASPRRLSYANVTSTLALIVALGGTSYAAGALPAGSVTSREIRDGSVRARDLHPEARPQVNGVTAPRRQRRERASVPGRRGAPGPNTVSGQPGPRGPVGARGE